MAVTGGLDISMNHSAAVISEDGQPIEWRFLTDKPTVYKLTDDDACTLYHDTRKAKGPERSDVLFSRLSSFYNWITMVMRLGQELGVTSWGVENYAMGKKHNAYHIGEFGGATRVAVMEADYPTIELVSIGAIKTRAGLPRLSKEKPFAFCLEEFEIDWRWYDHGVSTSDAGGDLADASVIALIVDERTK